MTEIARSSGSPDPLLSYRVKVLEDSHTDLSEAVSDLRDFANTLRAYARVALFVWPVAQAAITAAVTVAVMHLAGGYPS